MIELKPILEWYEQLPEPIRSQAIENYDHDFAKSVNGMAESQSDAIWRGFSWKDTEQGGVHWLDIHYLSERGEFDDPIDKLKSLITQLEERQKQFEWLLK